MGYAKEIKVGNDIIPIASSLYGTCDTAASVAGKVATLSAFDNLQTGVTVKIKFTYSNTATNPTLKVGSSAAKFMYRYGTTAVGEKGNISWEAGAIISFTYDGTAWIMNDFNENNISKTIVGDSKTATANVESNNGSTFLNHIENGEVTSYHLIEGSGATTVSSTSEGVIKISSTDNNDNTWRPVSVGGVNKLNSTTSSGSLNLSSGSGISVGFAAGSVMIGHTNAVEAGTASEGGSTRTLSFGGTFNVPSVTYDSQGHVASKGAVELTLPDNPNTDTKVTTTINENQGTYLVPLASTSATTAGLTISEKFKFSIDNSGNPLLSIGKQGSNKQGHLRLINTGNGIADICYEGNGGSSYFKLRNNGSADPIYLLDADMDIRNSYVRKISMSGSNSANSAGWYLAAQTTLTGYAGSHAVFVVYNTYSRYTQFGIFKISLRCENTSTALVKDFTWVVRERGYGYDYICCTVTNNTVKVYVYRDVYQYGKTVVECISESSTDSLDGGWEMVNSESRVSLDTKTYPIENCITSGRKTISTATAKTVTITVTGNFFKSGTKYYAAGLLRFHFNTAKLTSSTYVYGDYTYGNYNDGGNDGWLEQNGTSPTGLSYITTSIDSTSDTATTQERTITFNIALTSMSYITIDYDPSVYTVY